MSRVVGLLCAFCASAASAFADAGSVREAVYYGPGGPVRVKFHVTIGGRPADAVWAAAVDALFNLCDRNGDGTLDAVDRAAFVQPRRMRNVDVAPTEAVASLRLTFDNKDEAVSRAAFAAAVRTAGYGALNLTVVAGRADSQQLSDALFRHLDPSGRLAPDALHAARERLAFLDVNEDELLSAAELLDRAITTAARPSVEVGTTANEASGDSPDLLVFTPDGGPTVKQLLTARGGTRATTLRPTEFGAEGPTFAALDKDGNGRLDTAELAEWLRQPADLEFALSFGPTRLTPLGNAGCYRTEAGGAIAALLAGTHFRFEPPPGDAEQSARAGDAKRLRDQFRQLAGKAGAVRRKQLESQPGLTSLFDLADRRTAGEVKVDEFDAALQALAPLADCRATVTFFDKGAGLFELLDRNGDGQLSPRELIEATAVVKPLAWADGRVGPNDLPRRLEVRSAVASIPVLPPAPSAARPAVAGSKPPQAPAWFAPMDRNGDGDVSLREFVGPLELFRKLDRDGDGLIDAPEARAAKP